MIKFLLVGVVLCSSMTAFGTVVLKSGANEHRMGIVSSMNKRKQTVDVRGNDKKLYTLKIEDVFSNVIDGKDKSLVKPGNAVLFKTKPPKTKSR